MKYRINDIDNSNFDVIVEDGGVVSCYESDGTWKSLYYQDRLTEVDKSSNTVWCDQLSQGKTYINEWQIYDKDEMISDALGWLVFPAPESWERDDSIFSEITK